MPEFKKPKGVGLIKDHPESKSIDPSIFDPRAAINEHIARIAPSIKTEPRCRVCTHPNREWIELMLMRGYALNAISRSVPYREDEKPLHHQTLTTHYEEHMALDQAAIRAELEMEADSLQQNYVEGVRGAITKRGVLNIALRKAFEDILSGTTTVEPKDLIQIIKLHNDMESNSGDIAIEEAKAAISLFQQAITDVLSNEPDGERILKEIGNRIRSLREGQEIRQQLEAGFTSETDVAIPPTE